MHCNFIRVITYNIVNMKIQAIHALFKIVSRSTKFKLKIQFKVSRSNTCFRAMEI